MSDGNVGSILGGIVGLVLAPTGYGAVFFAVGSAVGGAIDTPSTPDQYGPRLDNLKSQKSDYGAVLPLILGGMRTAGTIIHGTKIKETIHVDKDDYGGFLGIGRETAETITYTYSQTFAVAIARGPGVISRIWLDNKLYWSNNPDDSVETISGSGVRVRVYDGSSTQEPASELEEIHGIDNVPAYRGTAYVVFDDLPLADFGNRTPFVEAEFYYNVDADIVEPQPARLFDYSYSFLSAPLVRIDRVSVGSWFGGTTKPEMFVLEGPNGIINDLSSTINTYFSGALITSSGEPETITDNFQQIRGRTPFPGVIFNNPSNGFVGVIQVEADGEKRATEACDYPKTNLNVNGVNTNTALDEFHVTNDRYYGFCKSTGRVFYSKRLGVPGSGLVGGSTTNYNGSMETFVAPEVLQTSSGKVVSLCATDSKLYILRNDDTIDIYSKYAEFINTIEFTTETAFAYKGGATRALQIYTEYDGAPIYIVGTDGDTYRINSVSGTTEFYDVSSAVGYDGFGIGTTVANYNFTVQSGVMSFITTAAGIAKVRRLFLDGASNQGIALDDAITEICTEAGLSASEYDVTELASDVLYGYAMNRVTTSRGNIEPLQRVFFFDVVEDDWKLKFIKRDGKSSIATIEDDNIGAAVGLEPAEVFYQQTKLEEESLPAMCRVSYLDIDNFYSMNVQATIKSTGNSQNILDIDIPIAMKNDQAAAASEVLLFEAWRTRNLHEFTTTPQFLKLKPTDVITVNESGNVHTLRITNIETAGILRLQCVTEDLSAYDSSRVGVPGVQNEYEIAPVGSTISELLDIPAMQFDDVDFTGFYYVAMGTQRGWRGSNLFMATGGGGFNYAVSATKGTILGFATNALGNADYHIIDNINTLSVKGLTVSLSSVDQQTFYDNMNNLVALEATGGWEILSFKTVEFNSSTLAFDLTVLRRGLFGTQQFINQHNAGDRFVVLNRESIEAVKADPSFIGQTLYYRSPSIGATINSVTTSLFNFNNVRQKPLAPAHLKAFPAGGGNYYVEWIPQDRLFKKLKDGSYQIMSDPPQNFRVIVEDSGRTQLSTTTTTDRFVTVSASVTNVIKVAQISALVGNGYFAEITI